MSDSKPTTATMLAILDTKLDGITALVGEKLNRQDERIDGIDTRVTGIDHRITQMEAQTQRSEGAKNAIQVMWAAIVALVAGAIGYLGQHFFH